MKRIGALLLAAALLIGLFPMGCAAGDGVLPDDALVSVSELLPQVRQELVYATADNFVGRQLYASSSALLRYGTVKKLAMVQEELAQQGLYLLLWDAFRPVSAQQTMWEALPNSNYVSNPKTGNRTHCRGNTVDVTLTDAFGNLLEMPSGFDDFTAKADRDYSDCTKAAAGNARLLETTMEKYGFKGYSGQWWMFTDTDDYPVEEEMEPVEPVLGLPLCEEFITLRKFADTSAPALARILKNEAFTVLAKTENFLYVNFRGQYGYVLRPYTTAWDAMEAPDYSTLFRAVLSSDGALTEGFSFRLYQSYLNDPAGFLNALAALPAYQISSIAAMVIYECPPMEREQLALAANAVSNAKNHNAVRAFLEQLAVG